MYIYIYVYIYTYICAYRVNPAFTRVNLAVRRFNTVTIKSIHHMRAAVPALLPGQTGAFVVKSRTKETLKAFGLRKGMVRYR